MKLPPISIAPVDKPPVWSVILPISAAVAGVAAFVVALVWGLM
jgi:hypothetical protein